MRHQLRASKEIPMQGWRI